MALFHNLCSLSLQCESFSDAEIVHKALSETKQYKDAIEVIKQYNSGMITFPEFRMSFIEIVINS